MNGHIKALIRIHWVAHTYSLEVVNFVNSIQVETHF